MFSSRTLSQHFWLPHFLVTTAVSYLYFHAVEAGETLMKMYAISFLRINKSSSVMIRCISIFNTESKWCTYLYVTAKRREAKSHALRRLSKSKENKILLRLYERGAKLPKLETLFLVWPCETHKSTLSWGQNSTISLSHNRHMFVWNIWDDEILKLLESAVK